MTCGCHQKIQRYFQWMITIMKGWSMDSSILVCQPQQVHTIKVLQIQWICLWRFLVLKTIVRFTCNGGSNLEKGQTLPGNTVKNTGIVVSSKPVFQMNRLTNFLTGSWKSGVMTVVTEDVYINTKNKAEKATIYSIKNNQKKLMLLLRLTRISSIFQNWYCLIQSAQGLGTSFINFSQFK